MTAKRYDAPKLRAWSEYARGFCVVEASDYEALLSLNAEMLEALERLVGDFEAEIHNEYDGTSMLKSRLAECDYARAAVAKARSAS